MNDAGGANGQAGSPKPKRRRGFLARWLRRFAIAGCLCIALTLALYLSRERTVHPLLVRYMPRISRALSPYEVSVSEIDGDWRHGLKLEGIRLAPHSGEQLVQSVKVESIEISGSLFKAVRGAGLAALTRIDVRAPRVVLDTTVPSKPGGTSKGLPPQLPWIQVERGELTIKSKGDTIRIGDLSAAGQGTAKEPWAMSLFAQSKDWSGAVDGGIHRISERSGQDAFALNLNVPSGVARGVDVAVRSLQGKWSAERLTLDSGSVRAGPNQLTIDGVTLSGSGADTVAGGRVGFEFPDLAAARRVVSAFLGPADDNPKTWSGSARGTFDLLEAPGQIATGAIQVTGEAVVIEDVELGSVSARLDVDRGSVTINQLRARASQGTMIDGSGSYLIHTRELVNVELGVRVERPSTLAPGLTWARGVDASLFFFGPLDRPSGRFSVRADGVVAGQTELRGLQAFGTLDEGVLTLDQGRTDTEFGTVALGARVVLPLAGASLDVLLQRLELSEAGAQLSLQQPARIGIEANTVRISGLKLAGSAGALDIDFEGGGAAAPNAKVSMEALRPGPYLRAKLSEWFGAPVDPGTVDGTLQYSSSPLRASADLTVSLDPTRLMGTGDPARDGDRTDPTGRHIQSRIRGSWDGSTLDLQEFKVNMPGASVDLTAKAELAAPPASQPATAPAGKGFVLNPMGELSLAGSFDIEDSWLGSPIAALALGAKSSALLESARGQVAGTLDLAGTWSQPAGTVSLTGTGLEWIRSAKIKSPKAGKSALPRPVRFDARLNVGEQITAENGTLELVDCLRLNVGGSLSMGLDLSAIANDPAGWVEGLLNAPLAGRATLDSEGLEELNVLVPDLRETSGQISGELRIAGTPGDPVVTGEVDIAEASARFRGAPPLENANVHFVLEQDQIRVSRGSLELGASPVRFEGSVLLGQGNPRIDAKISGDEVLLVRTSDARIRADLKLELHGRTDALVLGGDVLIKGGRVRSPIEFQSLLEGGSGAPRSVTRGFKIPAFGPPSLRLDARITTVKPLAVQGRIARGGIRADLRLTGTAAEPAPVGSIFFDPLELAVPAGTIVFPSGLVQFDRNAPEIPRIDIVGTTRLAGYDVTVSVEGDYDQPTVELSSSPSLPADDLLLLVLSGQPPNAGGGLEAAGQSVALYVAKDLVRGWFSSGGFEDEDRESFLDRLEVVTGRDVSRSGVLTVEATYKVRQGLARDKDALYVVLERDAYEDYGLGLRLVLRLR